MHSTAEDRTLLPEHRAEIAELCAFLDRAPQAAEPALLRGPDGSTRTLPPEVYEALMVVIRALSEGKGVTVAPVNTTLTTQEAADLLGVSRPRSSRSWMRAGCRTPARGAIAECCWPTYWRTRSSGAPEGAEDSTS